MDRPRFSVIVPAPVRDPVPAVLADLDASGRQDMEILLATGRNPSRQRNLAAERARGEILVFLDSDCRLPDDHLDRIEAHWREGRWIVGGPVLLRQPASPREELFQSFFAHPLLTGPSSARYRALGGLRRCRDAQLILCNLAVAREIFQTSGGFDERLYPNEENEWMARLLRHGESLWHDPELIVTRPQRDSWPAFLRTLYGYGRGRTRQSLLSGDIRTARHLPLLALLGALAAFVASPRRALCGALAAWLAYAFALRVTPVAGQRFSTHAAFCGPTLPVFYAIGQFLGLWPERKPRPTDVEIIVWRSYDGGAGARKSGGSPDSAAAAGR